LLPLTPLALLLVGQAAMLATSASRSARQRAARRTTCRAAKEPALSQCRKLTSAESDPITGDAKVEPTNPVPPPGLKANAREVGVLAVPPGLEPLPLLERPPGLPEACVAPETPDTATPSDSQEPLSESDEVLTALDLPAHPVHMRDASECPVCSGNAALLGACCVSIEGLPNALLSEPMMLATLQQAGLDTVAFSACEGDPCGEAHVAFSSVFVAMQCVCHFQGCQWDASGTEVTAKIVSPSEYACWPSLEMDPSVQMDASAHVEPSEEMDPVAQMDAPPSRMSAESPAFHPSVPEYAVPELMAFHPSAQEPLLRADAPAFAPTAPSIDGAEELCDPSSWLDATAFVAESLLHPMSLATDSTEFLAGVPAVVENSAEAAFQRNDVTDPSQTSGTFGLAIGSTARFKRWEDEEAIVATELGRG